MRRNAKTSPSSTVTKSDVHPPADCFNLPVSPELVVTDAGPSFRSIPLRTAANANSMEQ